MIQYLVTVHTEPDRYRATVREVAAHVLPICVTHDPEAVAGMGTASTAPAAILAAVISARIPALDPRTLLPVRETGGNGLETPRFEDNIDAGLQDPDWRTS